MLKCVLRPVYTGIVTLPLVDTQEEYVSLMLRGVYQKVKATTAAATTDGLLFILVYLGLSIARR